MQQAKNLNSPTEELQDKNGNKFGEIFRKIEDDTPYA